MMCDFACWAALLADLQISNSMFALATVNAYESLEHRQLERSQAKGCWNQRVTDL